jgi:hypothetical protein
MALATEALAHEEIRIEHGPRTGLPMVVAVHRTYRGRSLGGCRLWSYPGVDAAVRDAAQLSEAMTSKAAAANLPVGGGKGVIALGPGERLDGERRRAAFHDFAELVDSLDGRYVTAEDVGVGEDDMAEIARHTQHVVGGPVALGGAGDPSPYTALGVELAIRTALGEDSLEGAAVTVAGLGHVGARGRAPDRHRPRPGQARPRPPSGRALGRSGRGDRCRRRRLRPLRAGRRARPRGRRPAARRGRRRRGQQSARRALRRAGPA